MNRTRSNNKVLALLILLISLATSCKNKEFTKTGHIELANSKIDTIAQFNNEIGIERYTLTYNPKANGFVEIILINGDVYEARSVDGGSFSAIALLLEKDNIQFDQERKELIVN